jgi:peptide deformylase
MFSRTADLPPLLTLGNPRLAQPSTAVDPARISSAEFQARLKLLEEALRVHGANGVAAPQLGWFERHFVMRDPSGSGTIEHWINPVVEATSEDLVWYWEGCLSVPGWKAFVGRPEAIAVRGLDAQGGALVREYKDWEAHLFQHEFDHLDGVLFPYRVTDPRHLVTAEALEQRDGWPADWPTRGGRDAPIRKIAQAQDAKGGPGNE